jgi:DHA1 family bicyclomycin/chloramphenicol resistance-like MFS transporter
VCASIAGGGGLTYVSSSSFILIELLDVPVTVYGLLFSISAFGTLIGSLIAAKLNSRIGSVSTVWYGTLVLVVGGISIEVFPWLGWFLSSPLLALCSCSL